MSLTWPVIGRFLKWRHARLAMQIPVLLLAGLDDLRRPGRAAARAQEPGDGRRLAALPRPRRARAAGRRQPVLHGLSLHAAAARRAAGCASAGSKGGRPVPACCAASGSPLRSSWPSSLPTSSSPCGPPPGGRPGSCSPTSRARCRIDTIFQGAAFCKYVCPLGQFNFFGSLFSPLEIKVREPGRLRRLPDQGLHHGAARPRSPATRRPLRQRRRDAPASSSLPAGIWNWRTAERRGLGKGLRACALPAAQGGQHGLHVLPRLHPCLPLRQHRHPRPQCPAKELWTDPWRSGIGRFSQRWDLAALVVVFTFGAFLNAFDMIQPVYGVAGRAGRGCFDTHVPRARAVLLLFVFGLVVAARAPARRCQSRHAYATAGRVARRDRSAGTSGRSRRWVSACGWRTTGFTF